MFELNKEKVKNALKIPDSHMVSGGVRKKMVGIKIPLLRGEDVINSGGVWFTEFFGIRWNWNLNSIPYLVWLTK